MAWLPEAFPRANGEMHHRAFLRRLGPRDHLMPTGGSLEPALCPVGGPNTGPSTPALVLLVVSLWLGHDARGYGVVSCRPQREGLSSPWGGRSASYAPTLGGAVHVPSSAVELSPSSVVRR